MSPEDFKPRSLPLAPLALPAPGVVHLWFFDLTELGDLLMLGRAKDPNPLSARHLRTARRFYQRLLLGAYLGIPGRDVRVVRTTRGKPALADDDLRKRLNFNVSYSGSACLMGVSNGASLGIDLERRGRTVARPIQLALRYFNAWEHEALAALPPDRLDRAFLQTWACKEALVKGLGRGIADQLHRFAVSCDPDQPVSLLAMENDDARAWRVATLAPTDTHIGAVALRHSALRLEGFRIQAPQTDT